jgi:cell division protein ZapA
VLAAMNLAYALAGRPPAKVASTAPVSGATSGEVDIDGLIARLDQALGADGQLL